MTTWAIILATRNHRGSSKSHLSFTKKNKKKLWRAAASPLKPKDIQQTEKQLMWQLTVAVIGNPGILHKSANFYFCLFWLCLSSVEVRESHANEMRFIWILRVYVDLSICASQTVYTSHVVYSIRPEFWVCTQNDIFFS